MEMNFKNHLNYIFLFGIPLSFIVGIAITEFLVFVSIIYFLFLSEQKFFFNKITIFLLIFTFYIFVNSLIKIDDDLRLSSFFYLRYLFFTFAIFFVCNLIENKNINYYLIIFFFLYYFFYLTL